MNRVLNRKPRFWTDERRRELQRLLNLEWTSVQIANHFGVTPNSVQCASRRYRLTSKEAHALRQSRRFRGKKLGRKHLQSMSKAMKRRHADPAFHAKVMAAVMSKAARKAANDSRRGFSIPEEMQADYQLLRRKLRSAKEAGRVLGLLKEEAA